MSNSSTLPLPDARPYESPIVSDIHGNLAALDAVLRPSPT